MDYNCRDAPLYDGCGGGVGKTFPCGGYPPDTKVIQTFQAGQVINVRFGNAQYGSPGQPELTPSSNQARHAGGLCEFSLSYDQGRTFGVFARYHGSCPDMFYDWPVRLPSNLPSCESCIFGKENRIDQFAFCFNPFQKKTPPTTRKECKRQRPQTFHLQLADTSTFSCPSLELDQRCSNPGRVLHGLRRYQDYWRRWRWRGVTSRDCERAFETGQHAWPVLFPRQWRSIREHEK